MSIIRLTCVHSELFAPTTTGEYQNKPYLRSRRVGLLGDFVRRSGDTEPAVSNDLDHYIRHSLAVRARNLAPDDPVVVMTNGFLFDPRTSSSDPADKSDNPHVRLFHNNDFGPASEIRHHTTGWPRGLGIAAGGHGGNGLTVAFGWYSNPGFATSLMTRFRNFYARAYDLAGEAAWPFLATLIALSAHLPARNPIDIFCHSLGSRVVVRALALAAKHNLPVLPRIGRVVILGGSEYCGEGQLMYSRMMESARAGGWDAGTGPYVYNIVSRENAILDLLGENFGPGGFFSNKQVLGHDGLAASPAAERWMDLHIDGRALRRWVRARFRIDISGDNPESIWDHWYYYMHRGNMRMYRSIFRDRAAWSFAAVRDDTGQQTSIPEGVAFGGLFRNRGGRALDINRSR